MSDTNAFNSNVFNNATGREPVALLSSTGDPKRVVLFTIDDVQYTIPDKPRPNIALKFLHTLKETRNAELASAELLETMVGKEGYAALMNFDDLEPKDLKRVMDIAKEIALGGMEDTTKN